ncbi:hypothetical protein HDEF_1193 [Candidatus Hamiltonella defensa 5AT (Acyrthosiphon pisum)]|uniref:Uncharacterized protein n=1 Tax=Hamiltonella defensa subsp. Acyrthosiphon pisum (strain 5AT) TaxID=572265 RepID=C4K5K9_HAMD5|nr:hypothetical protein HDEF_1193 [Candidatus Hamiltonella defensa 5AT (Acyrthosiphon pisum)]
MAFLIQKDFIKFNLKKRQIKFLFVIFNLLIKLISSGYSAG